MLLTGGVCLLLAAVLTAPSSAQDLHSRYPDSSITFDLVSGFEVVVQGQIGEQDGLRFILDTGSSYSLIDRRVADRMGLHRRPGNVFNGDLFNFDRNLAVEWADVSELGIGAIHVAAIPMIVIRLAGISEFTEGADGIIGMDVLSRARKISIDYRRRRILFELDEGHGSQPSAVKAFVVPVVIQGVSMHLLVDTGFQYVLLYKDRLRSALPQLRTEGESRDGVIGHLQVTQVNLPGIQIFGPKAVTPVLLLDGPRKTNTGDLDGYLGPASLHARRLELDFAGNTLRWQ
jgi:predicted aspartyl protease